MAGIENKIGQSNQLKVETKEDLKKIIDKSTDYGELYENSIKILREMEASFKNTLEKIANKEWWNSEKIRMIEHSIFDERLNTTNPITIFEKKWADLLRRWKNIAENNKVLNAWIQLYKKLWWERLNQRWKDLILNELWETKENAIKNFQDDIDDGILSNVNNVKINSALFQWELMWEKIFWSKESMQKRDFESYVDKMTIWQLMFWTFNIHEGSWAFRYCYGKIKEKLGSKNLFDFIDSQKKIGDQKSELLKYSAFKSLFERKQIKDLEWWINSYSGNKQILLNYVKKQLKSDKPFKIAFLTSIKELEDSKNLWSIAKDLKNADPDVKLAYRKATQCDNVDCFKNWKVDGLVLYDNEWHGWGSAFFQSELQLYKNKWFSISPKEENSNFIKYDLKKGSDSITMVQLKMSGNRENEFDTKKIIAPLVQWKNYNLFALRWHCYNTDKMALALWGLNVVWEWDILIDWWCWNANKVGNYYSHWVKWQIFAYTSEWRWASTQAFIEKIITAKNSWKKFSEILRYYNALNSDESSVDWYFALNVERPDSVASKYRLLTKM